MDDLTISKATVADIAALLGVQRRAFAEEALVYGSRIAPMAETDVELAAVFGSATVVLKGTLADGRIVASVRARLDAEGVCHVGRLAVEPEFQNRGFGRTMLRAAQEAFAGVVACELFTGAKTEKTQRLYMKEGYRRVGTCTTPDGVEHVVLRLDLPRASAD